MSLSTAVTLAGWRWRQYGKQEPWHQCAHEKPTTEIFTDLLDAERIPDPFLDQNERLVQWVGETDWEYACDFQYKPNEHHSRQDLVLEGLDTIASVYLNNELEVLQSTNMFHRHRVDVTDQLRVGTNTLRIVFRNVLAYGRTLEAKNGRYRAFNGDSSRLHVRKAQYHYGWDWGPVLLTCGPYREVKLESYACIASDAFVYAKVSDDLGTATLEVSLEVVLDQDVSVDIKVTSPSGTVFYAHTVLAVTESHSLISLDISKPELWYPVGHGPQVFYLVEVDMHNGQNAALQTIKKRVGVRRVRLVQQPLVDEPGTTFFFEVNNQPVYISGSNWIPDHSFLTALAPKDYTSAVETCLEGNQNMIRIWGGGVYEHEALYEECDRRGVLVWQDFMFACGQYPCYPEFAANVQREATDQVKRLRQYCSIVLYAGNNEDYSVAEMLQLDWNPDDHSGDWTNTNFPARALYETYLPAIVADKAPGIPYHPSSPWGGKGTEDRTVGDIHQWNVWHGSQAKYQLWDKLTGRFVSEFGMLSFPAARSIRRFVTDPKQLYPQSPVLDHHNKADGAERRLALYVMENVRVSSMDLDTWIYATQLVQAECLGFAVRSCRRQWKGSGREYCGGHLVWQINDCWPVSSWALVDFYGERKLAYYAMKRDGAPLSLGISRSTPELKKLKSPPLTELGPPHDLASKKYFFDIWAVNVTLQEVHAVVEVRLYDIATGHLRDQKSLGSKTLPSNCTTELAEDLDVDEATAVHVFMLDENDGRIIARASDWPQPLKYLNLPISPNVTVSVLDGKVEIRADAPVKGVEVCMADSRRDVSWDDNGVDVFPDDVYTIYAKGLVKDDDVHVRYYGTTF